MGSRWGNSGNSVRLYFGGAPKSLQMVAAAMKLKDTNMIEKYTYDYTKNSCFDGKCDIKKINNFTNKFLNFLLN